MNAIINKTGNVIQKIIWGILLWQCLEFYQFLIFWEQQKLI